jgi:hypothetical protein
LTKKEKKCSILKKLSMPKKTYHIEDEAPTMLAEPAVAYGKCADRRVSTSNDWNPNVPLNCTQEEFLEHIHRIEQGNFMTIEEADIKFEVWRKDYLTSHM